MIMKGLFDQSYKILHKDRYHLENIPSHGKVNFTFPNLNVDNPEENLDKDRSFSSTQETSLTKSQEFSLNDPNSESPLILNNQKKKLDNMRAKNLALKSFFMNEIYDVRLEISTVQSQLEQE